MKNKVFHISQKGKLMFRGTTVKQFVLNGTIKINKKFKT